MVPNMPRPIPPYEAGTALLETIWYAYANRILEKAIQLYNVNDESRQEELRLKFARRGDYTVRSTESVIQKTDAGDS